ncbi:hypothetical protein AC579_8094 [Pseudocercospora musae]|uniref:Uncharacterized protein n=1 Tax=Pseudocercospora musae TaxID=113226 RepID=A0A139IG69_9PEZI|nr:hypothetical protein AC579_8094 [Pseudocercospora musae]
MVLPIMDVQENYRDEQACEPLPVQDAWDELWLAPTLRAPEIIVPIGQVPYHSRMTDRQEMLPVCASVLSKEKTDLSLIQTIENVLRHAHRPLSVATGRQMFEPGWDVVEHLSTS